MKLIQPKMDLLLETPPSLGLVVSTFNQTIGKALLEGAKELLASYNVNDPTVLFVPGAFEIPWGVSALLKRSLEFEAIITLGAVIEGQTPHFSFICSQLASGLQSISLEKNIPVIFGVLTCQTEEQALSRSGLKGGNKGEEAALAALKTIAVSRQLDQK